MAYVKGINIVIGADTTKLDSALSRIDKNSRSLNKELREVNNSLKFDPRNPELLAQKQKILNERFSETKKRLDALRQAQDQVNQAYANGDISGDDYRKFQSDIAITESKLKGYQEELKLTSKEYEHHASKIGQASNAMNDFGDKALKQAEKLKPFSIAAAGVLGVVTKQAMDFESAFAGVQKTFPGTQEELAKTRQEIRELAKEIPTTTTELSSIAENAGQLGIQAGSIMSFTRTIADLGESTNLTGEEAAQTLAKFANITKMDQAKFGNLGSSIVRLGNEFATTERDIAAMAMRLAGAGSQVGMSEADILGLSTALSSVGIEAEMGGSAISKVMINMAVASEMGLEEVQKLEKATGMSRRQLELLASNNSKDFKGLADSIGMTAEEMNKIVKSGKNLENFSAIAGMTADEFKKAFQEDAVGALGHFINGLGTAEEKGSSAIEMLDEMGISEVRLRDSLLRAGNANELFAKSIKSSNEAWDENVALTNEANLRYETTESKVQIMKNKLNDVAISLGEKVLPHVIKFTEWLGEMTEKFNSLSPEVQGFIIKALGITAVAAPLLGVVGKISKGFGSLLGTIGSVGRSIGLFQSAAAAGTTGLSTIAGGTASASAGMAGLSAGFGGAVVAAAPFVLGTAAVAAGAYAIYDTLSKDTIPAVDMFADHTSISYEQVRDADGQLITTIKDNSFTFSEETKVRLGAFFEMSQGVQQENMNLFSGLTTVTNENVETLKTKFGEMTQYLKDEIKKQAEENVQDYTWLKESGITLTDEQEKEMLKIINEGSTNKLNELEHLRGQYAMIMDEIKKQATGATEEQQENINTIIDKMNKLAIESLSANEAEQNALFNRLGANNTRVTAEMVGNVVKEYNRMYDESVQKAGENHAEQYRIAQELREDGSEEAKLLADEIERQADRQYESVTESARKTRTEGLDKLKVSYSDLMSSVDLNTGEILTNWNNVEKLWNSQKYEDKRALIVTEQRTEYTTVYKPAVYQNTNGYGANRPGHNDGLDYVPYNNYVARLHKGESVLTAEETRQLKAQGYLNSMKDKLNNMANNIVNSIDNSVENINFTLAGTYYIREEADLRKLAIHLATETQRKKRGG